MITLKVADIHCQACVDRISKVLDGEKIEYSISLQQKTVTVDEEKTAQKVIDILDDIGFDAVR